ncbi:MAG: DUF4861 family protein [Leeuwenhoekiella sp.]
MKPSLFLVLSLIFAALNACDQEQGQGQTITITNDLTLPRSLETVEVRISDIVIPEGGQVEEMGVVDVNSGEVVITQQVDEDGDGTMDVLLFQPEIESKGEKKYRLEIIPKDRQPDVVDYCFSRFVPERTDDYAWENNRVAFRTFGPKAQQMVEDSIKGGTLASGIDAWLKRVEYPIINKWYKRNDEKQGAYHKDEGEGLDNFHVGISRGVGGIAVKNDTTFAISKNFIKWETIAVGPIRTEFVLTYADWESNGIKISEKKRISLDYGSQLSKFLVEISGTDNLHAGLTVHEKDGSASQNEEAGYIAYWQPHDDSDLGTGIVVPKENWLASEMFDSDVADWSNLYTNVEVDEGKAVYYAGFGWKKAGKITSSEEWNAYLEDFAKKVNNPLKVTLN